MDHLHHYRRKRIILWGSILMLLVVLTICAQLFLNKHVGQPAEEVALHAGLLSYSDPYQGFSIYYDPAFSITASPAPWLYGGESSEQLLALTLPATFQPQTNFREATLVVAASPDTTTCLTALPEEQTKNTITIDGVAFQHFSTADAGAGNFYEVERYRVVHNNRCFSIETLIHYVNLGVYDPSQGIKPYDEQEVKTLLLKAVTSVEFS